MLIGASILTMGASPAFAKASKAVEYKTYTSFAKFLTDDGKFNFLLSHGYNMVVAWVLLGLT